MVYRIINVSEGILASIYICILSGYTEVMPIVPECITRWSKVHYEQVRSMI